VPIASLSPGSVLPDIRSIAVLRANALGDYLFAVPALNALRAAYPAAEIVFLGADWHADFLADRPGPVDRVVPIPPSVGVRQPSGEETEDETRLAAFFKRMNAECFDLAIQMHGGGRYSNPFVRRLGARRTVGFRAPDAAPLDISLRYALYQPEVLRLLELVGLVGAVPGSLEPVVAVTERDRKEADHALAGLPRPVVAIHPGATDVRRRWPAQNFATVADVLAASGASVVVTGSAGERDVVQDVIGRMRAKARALVDATTIGGLGGIYSRCLVVVSNDTGPRHLAQAVGTATVAVYWCGNLITAGPLTRRRHRPHVSWTIDCPTCGVPTAMPEVPADPSGRRCEHNPSFVASVSVDAVIADALDLLSTEAQPAQPSG
jgi:ADP-heptose:LPS heptosyltransferase